MDLKIKKGSAADIINLVPSYIPVPLWKCDKNTLLYLQRIAKKSNGAIRMNSLPIVYLASELIKKKSTKNYDIYRI